MVQRDPEGKRKTQRGRERETVMKNLGGIPWSPLRIDSTFSSSKLRLWLGLDDKDHEET